MLQIPGRRFLMLTRRGIHASGADRGGFCRLGGFLTEVRADSAELIPGSGARPMGNLGVVGSDEEGRINPRASLDHATPRYSVCLRPLIVVALCQNSAVQSAITQARRKAVKAVLHATARRCCRATLGTCTYTIHDTALGISCKWSHSTGIKRLLNIMPFSS